MFDHQRLLTSPRLVFLLAAMLIMPLWSLVLVTGPTQTDQLRVDSYTPSGHSTTFLGTAVGRNSALPMKALPTENEEQDPSEAPDSLQVSILIHSTFRSLLDARLIPPDAIPSYYPLRC